MTSIIESKLQDGSVEYGVLVTKEAYNGDSEDNTAIIFDCITEQRAYELMEAIEMRLK